MYQKRWGSETSDKLEKSQFFHRCPSLQNGGNPYPQKPTQKRGLACKDRLEGRLFLSPDKSKTQEVSLLPIQRQLIPIQLPPLWPGLSPMGLYQNPEADSSSRMGAGDTVGGIDQGPCVRPDISFSMPRIHNKLGEDNSRTIPALRIPGFHGGRHQYGAEPPNSENRKDLGGVSTTIGGGACDMLHLLKVNWQNECHKPCDSTSSSFLQIDLASALRRGNQEYKTTLAISPDSREELIWWDTQMIKWNGRMVLTTEPDLTIESDASTQGWGASHQSTSTGGPWSPQEKKWHINCLELLAATLALKTFVKHKTGISVLMKIDNTTAVAYINNQGGTVSMKLISLTQDLWMWCLERNIHIQAQYLLGVMNQTADRESRSMNDRSDWSLDHSTFQRINRLYGPLEVDLFASRLTNQCHRYFSWRPDPFLEATDAFQRPPWNLIPRVLMKTQTQGADVILVAPVWKTQPWYPFLLSLVVDWPRLLPRLAMWSISGKALAVKAFQDKLQSLSSTLGDQKLADHINYYSSNGIAGVLNGVQISFQDL